MTCLKALFHCHDFVSPRHKGCSPEMILLGICDTCKPCEHNRGNSRRHKNIQNVIMYII